MACSSDGITEWRGFFYEEHLQNSLRMNANSVFHTMILKKTEDICGKVSRRENKKYYFSLHHNAKVEEFRRAPAVWLICHWVQRISSKATILKCNIHLFDIFTQLLAPKNLALPRQMSIGKLIAFSNYQRNSCCDKLQHGNQPHCVIAHCSTHITSVSGQWGPSGMSLMLRKLSGGMILDSTCRQWQRVL